jgi:hypothetical protein
MWRTIWTPWNYEPDRLTTMGYGGAGIHQFDGWLYWSTDMVPTRAGYIHENCLYSFAPCYGQPQNDAEEDELFNGTWRATTLWRGRNLEASNPEIQLLYGESELPMYSGNTRSFDMTPTGWTPLWGHSGYEEKNDLGETIVNPNPYNAYTWTMDVAFGKLWLGTYDVGGGADLWRLDSSNATWGVKREDGNGIGDRNNYGIRTMEVSADGKILYLGMATDVNLVGSPSSSRKGPGWELRALAFSPIAAPVINPAGTTFTDSMTVSIAVSTAGAAIRYTLDGSEPTENSELYTGEITLTGTTTVKARGFLADTLPSATTTVKYTLQAPPVAVAE